MQLNTNTEVYTLVILTDGFDQVLIVADFTLKTYWFSFAFCLFFSLKKHTKIL